MKLRHIINVFIGLIFVWISTSCESYLDKLPDNRANLNSEDNITDLLVSAYPTVAICMLGEASSDNIKDNGINYGTLNQVVEEYYRWQPSTQKNADSPTHLWEGYYGAIAVANQALEAIDLSDNPDELNAARDSLIAQKPLVQAYVIDQVRDKMIGGEAALGVIYSGEAIFTQRENSDLEYVIPKEGTNVWIDSWVIPKNAPNKENAEKFIDFMCRGDVALKNFEYIT